MIGWDPQRVMVLEGSEALVRHAKDAHGLAAVRSAVASLPLADGSTQVLCLLDVIEHLDDPHSALLEAVRVLAPDGRLVINVPAHEWLWSSADEHLGHRRRYVAGDLRSALAEVGFTPTLISHVFSWLVPPMWVERRLRHSAEPALGHDRSSFLIDRAAMVLTTIERLLLGRIRLPVGTSLLCVAERTAARS
jgi:SAM-dependent methyltransferase